jgi:hypothetical protein
MTENPIRYFVGFLITLGLIIVLIVLLFHGGGHKSTQSPEQNQVTAQELVDFANTSTVVKMTQDGLVNAESQHQQVQITVGKDNVSYAQIKGYQGDVVNSHSYTNNENAYSAFLYSLARASYTAGSKDPKQSNYLGRCPLGSRYVFEIYDGDQLRQRYWATSCGGAKTYGGDLNLTISLFQLQVPNYSDLTQDLDSL